MPDGQPNTIKVLSVDGGGIRGIIPAVLLGEIQKRPNKELCQTFDLIAGTSTGGIIALGLGTLCNNGKPYTPDQLLNLYLQTGSAIFRKTWLTLPRRLAVHSDKILPVHGVLHRPDSAPHLQLQSPETASFFLQKPPHRRSTRLQLESHRYRTGHFCCPHFFPALPPHSWCRRLRPRRWRHLCQQSVHGRFRRSPLALSGGSTSRRRFRRHRRPPGRHHLSPGA